MKPQKTVDQQSGSGRRDGLKAELTVVLLGAALVIFLIAIGTQYYERVFQSVTSLVVDAPTSYDPRPLTEKESIAGKILEKEREVSQIVGTKGDALGGHIGAFANLAALFFVFGAFVFQSRQLQIQQREFSETEKRNRSDAEAAEKRLKEERDRYGDQVEHRRLDRAIQLRGVRESFIMQFLVNLREIESLFGSRDSSRKSGWAVVKFCASVTSSYRDSGPLALKLGPFQWANLQTYLRQVDFIVKWAQDKEHPEDAIKFMRLIAVNLPATIARDLVEFDYFFSPEIKALSGLTELVRWRDSSSG